MLLGCVADDFTGASDIANTLSAGGMAVTQYNGIPDKPALEHVEAGVVSLKSRTAPVEEAVETSLSAAQWLIEQGCSQIFFKYCSTFDSTPEGNIGPVADALAGMLGEEKVVFCPAFPETGRSVYQGHLFVGDVPLHESGMKDHPLTPMKDADLRRWLARQTKRPVFHLDHSTVAAGADHIRAALENGSPGNYVADAISTSDLLSLGGALKDCRLVTGGSGLAVGLPENFIAHRSKTGIRPGWQGTSGRAVVLSGSCSVTTRQQVATFCETAPNLELTAENILCGKHPPASLAEWVLAQNETPIIYTTADPAVVRAAQGEFGQDFIAEKIETLFGELAIFLAQRGIERIVSAGGETSGAIVSALGIDAMEIGPQIAPGVPALKATDSPLWLALKSGNFGGEDFFREALLALGK